MQNKGLFVLSGLTLAVLVAAGWAVRSRSSGIAAADAGGEALFVNLETRVNEVEEVFIEDAGGSATLRREGGEWVLVERGSYPARFTKIKETVVGIARLEIEEPKTRKPENHAQLGVQDPGADEASSKRVVLRTADGEELAHLILGETQYRRGSQAVYARRDGEDQVYLCSGKVTLDTRPASWIETEILRLESDRVQDVRILHKDGEEVLISRDPENHTQFVVENIPPDREAKFAGAANSIGTALSYLGLEDVRRVSEVDFEIAPKARAWYRCPDGLVIEVETAAFEEQVWARLVASYEEPTTEIGPPAPTTDEAGDEEAGVETGADDDEGEADVAAAEAVLAEVEELNATLGGWAYAIPQYKGDVLARRMVDLLAEVPDESSPQALQSGETLDLDALSNPSVPEQGDDPLDSADEEPAPAQAPGSEDGA